MRVNNILVLCCLSTITAAFVPPSHTRRFAATTTGTRQRVAVTRNLLIDPSIFHDVPHHVDSLRDAFFSSSFLTLADGGATVDAVTDAVTSTASDAASATAAATSDTATAAADAANNNGWFGFLTGPIEGLLQLIHSTFVAVGLNSDAWGISILALTVLIKIITFPLTKSQLESTNKMQVCFVKNDCVCVPYVYCGDPCHLLTPPPPLPFWLYTMMMMMMMMMYIGTTTND